MKRVKIVNSVLLLDTWYTAGIGLKSSQNNSYFLFANAFCLVGLVNVIEIRNI